MQKKYKRIISLMLCFILLFTTMTQVFAEPMINKMTLGGKNYDISVLKDNAKFRIVQVTDGDEMSTVVFDKKTGESKIDFQANKSAEKQTSSVKVDLDSKIEMQEPIMSLVPVDSGSNISGTYSYDCSANYVSGQYQYYWDVSIPNSSCWGIKETPTNSGALESFRGKVNDIYLKEIEIAGSFGTGVLSVIIACLTAAPETLGTTAVVALLVAAGAATAAAVLGAQLYFIKKDARYYFNRI